MKERLVICNEEGTDGRARVTRDVVKPDHTSEVLCCSWLTLHYRLYIRAHSTGFVPFSSTRFSSITHACCDAISLSC